MHRADYDDLPEFEVKIYSEREIREQLTSRGSAVLVLADGRQLRGVVGAMSGKTAFLDSMVGDVLTHRRIFGAEQVDMLPTSLSYSTPPTLPRLRCSGISLAALEFLYAIEIAAERATKAHVWARLFEGHIAPGDFLWPMPDWAKGI